MFKQYTYLYVEDDPLSREIMQMIMVNAMGIERLTMLEHSQNFMEVVSKLTPCPEVFLLDIHVRPHSGFDMLKMLRADGAFRKAKVIALTASVMDEEVDRLRSSGFDGGIGKPLSVRTFPALMERILQGVSVWHVVDA